MPRGGKRVGAPGANYSNRTDLQQGPRALPVTAAPDQQYGDAGAQRQAQQAVPMANAPLPPQQGPDTMGSANQFQPPPVIPMGAPSMNPGEPVTAGATSGAGPGPSLNAPTPLLSGIGLLTALGDAASPETKAILASLTANQNNQAAP